MENESTDSGYRRELYTEQARKDRFKRIAEYRTNKVLNDLRILGNTGNKTLYQYEQVDIDKIFATIESKLIETRARFKSRTKEKPFTLG